MKVKTHFALFVSILAARVRESACVNSRERLKEAFIQQLILAKRFICSVIARTGVRRADDIEDVYQETCLRLIRYFDRLLIENPVKLLRIAFNIKAYLAKAANRTAITWLRREARERNRTEPIITDSESESGVRGKQLADRNQVSAEEWIEAKEKAAALRAIHLEVMEKLAVGKGANLIQQLAELQQSLNGGKKWDSYSSFLWVLGYLFGAEKDDAKRRDLSAALIGKMTGLANEDPVARASKKWQAARVRLDVQVSRMRGRADKVITQLLPASYGADPIYRRRPLPA